MSCSKTKRLAGRNWPLYRTTGSGLCCYKVVANSEDEAAAVIEDAQTKPDYVKRSQSYEVPDIKIQVYLYFFKS